jgi:hypothetical protein
VFSYSQKSMKSRIWPILPLPLLVLELALGCAVSPARLDADPRPAENEVYAGPHGRPMAFGGDVCPILNPHLHPYGPVPRAAFSRTEVGLVDHRARYPYRGMHAHHGRTCTRADWHWHLEPPLPDLKMDARVGAFTEDGEVPLVRHGGSHPPGACGRAQTCTFHEAHGHAPCPK